MSRRNGATLERRFATARGARVRAAGGTTDAVASALEEGPIDMQVLKECEVSARGPWLEREDIWQEKRQEWFQEHQARMREPGRRRP